MAIYMLRGNSTTRWLPAVADLATGITSAEWTAGADFGNAVTALSGLEPQSSKINVPIQKQRAEAQIEGPETFQDAVITIVEDDGTGTDADALERQEALEVLDEGAQGVFVFSRGKANPATGDQLFAMRGTVGSQVPNWNLDASAATTAVNFNPSTRLTKTELLA